MASLRFVQLQLKIERVMTPDTFEALKTAFGVPPMYSLSDTWGRLKMQGRFNEKNVDEVKAFLASRGFDRSVLDAFSEFERPKYIADVLDDLVYRQELARSLASTDSWRRVAVELSRVHQVITVPWIDEIKAWNTTPAAQAEAFLTKVSHLIITEDDFRAALDRAGLGRVAKLPSSSSTQTIASPPTNMAASPYFAAQQSQPVGKIVDISRKLKRGMGFMVTIALNADLSDGAVIPATLLVCDSVEDADDQAEQHMDKALDAVDGKDGAVKEGYAVAKFVAWHGPKRTKHEGRRVDLKGEKKKSADESDK